MDEAFPRNKPTCRLLVLPTVGCHHIGGFPGARMLDLLLRAAPSPLVTRVGERSGFFLEVLRSKRSISRRGVRRVSGARRVAEGWTVGHKFPGEENLGASGDSTNWPRQSVTEMWLAALSPPGSRAASMLSDEWRERRPKQGKTA